MENAGLGFPLTRRDEKSGEESREVLKMELWEQRRSSSPDLSLGSSLSALFTCGADNSPFGAGLTSIPTPRKCTLDPAPQYTGPLHPEPPGKFHWAFAIRGHISHRTEVMRSRLRGWVGSSMGGVFCRSFPSMLQPFLSLGSFFSPCHFFCARSTSFLDKTWRNSEEIQRRFFSTI